MKKAISTAVKVALRTVGFIVALALTPFCLAAAGVFLVLGALGQGVDRAVRWVSED